MTQAEVLKILKMGRNVFLTGPAGSGKTHVLNEYITFLKEHGVTPAVTASTGIAATHLKGVTIHSWSGIGIKDMLTDYDIDALEQKSYLWKRFEKTHVLIIDEISMLSASTLDCVDRVAKMFKRNEEPFGGMQVIFSGDFFQLPPIEKKNYSQQAQSQASMDGIDEFIPYDDEISLTPFAFKSRAWKDADLHTCYLSTQYRQRDNELLSILGEMRDGEFSDQSIELLNQRITQSEDDTTTKLFTHNANVDDFNIKKLLALPTESKTYKMISKGRGPIIDSLKRGCLVPEVLELRKGALVMFVKNNPIAGYANGTTGEIIDFEEGYPVVQTRDGTKHVVTPQSWSVEEGARVLGEISQIPLKLAWAVTVHKSQGMTLDAALIDLSKAFVEGQGYVALSRVKSLDGLFLKGFNRQSLETHQEVRNVDIELRRHSDSIYRKFSDLPDKEFKTGHESFMDRIGAKKFKTVDDAGEKLSTHQISCQLVKKQKSLEDIAEERSLKAATIISHIEKLLDEKALSKADILYLKPSTEAFQTMLEEVREETHKLDEFKLTPVFKALDGKYSFEDIRFAKLFC